MTGSIKFPHRLRVMILLYFLILITYLDRVSISLVGVRIKSAFHLSNTQFGWVLSAFVLAYALFEIPSGIMGDRLGQRKVMLRIVIWWSVFTALTGCVNGLTSLILVRFLFGMGEAGAYPNSCGVISRWVPKSETSRGMSWLGMGASTGGALAPMIVVPIASAFGWRAPFFVNAILGLIWVLVCWLWYRNEPREMKRITKEEKELIENNRNYVKHNQMFPWKKIFRNPMLWALFFSYFCIQWANYFFTAWMPNYLQEGKHFSEKQMGTIMSFVFAAGFISSLLSGVISDWLIRIKGNTFARKTIAMVSFGLMAMAIFFCPGNKSNPGHHQLCGCRFFTGNDRINLLCHLRRYWWRPGIYLTGIMNFCGQSGLF